MGLPDSPEARTFYRVACQRFIDAQFLVSPEVGRTTGAIYLAGYGVECILKALILARSPPTQRKEMLAEFHGQKAHDFNWLRTRYLHAGGPGFPPEIVKAFALVNTWDTEWRYRPGLASPILAKKFLIEVQRIIQWAEKRL